MTYNEWRDELKSNLLSVSEPERRRVLDYYAEAYADRREAGFSEREIIEEFGAPYDAAQKILHESVDDEPTKTSSARADTPTRGEETGETFGDGREDIYRQPPRGKVRSASATRSASSSPAGKKKHRTAKIVISIISAILILGIIYFIVVSAISCSINATFTEAHYAQQTGSVQNIKIDAQVGEVETVFYEGDKIEIEYHTSNIYNVKIDENGGTLTYRQHIKRWLMLTGTINYPKTTIKLPASEIYNLDVDLSAGSTTVNGGTFGNLNIDLSAGKVNLSGQTVCNSLYVHLSAGKVDIGKVECAGKVKINLSAGQVDIDEISCTNVDIDLSAGTVGIGKLTCPKIYVDLSAGTVRLGVVGQKSEYSIAVDKSAGSCNVSNQSGTDANKLIDVDLSAGNVTISFTD